MARAGLDPEAVVDAAAAIADGEGPEAVSLARVASALGVRTPSLYVHVGGLDDLRRRLATRGTRELAETMREAAVGRSGEQALRAVAEDLRAFAHEHPGLYMAAQRAPDPGDEEWVAAAAAAVDVLRALLAGYELDGSEAIHAARAVRSALHGFVTLEAAGGFGLAEDVDESYSRLLDLIDRGLRPDG